MKAADLFDLLRIPNVTTAVSDVVAAGAIATGAALTNGGAALSGAPLAAGGWQRLALAAAASAALYSAGMALNDVADAPVDAAERPTRPIPSGRVRRSAATALALGLLALGLTLARGAGTPAFLTALLLAGAIALYDLWLSGRPLVGPLGMATCRALNLLMGLLAVGDVTTLGGLAMGILALYIVGVTHLSLGEVTGSRRAHVVFACVTTTICVAGVLVLAVMARSGAVPLWARGAALAGGLALWLTRPTARLRAAWARGDAGSVGAAVGALVSGVLWLDACFSAAVAPLRWLLPFLVLGSLQALLRRRFRVT